ncbi:MAG: 50S ribosomal protein L31e [Candidatus Hadarchaeia archaeon]
MEEEQVYTIPLRGVRSAKRRKRAAKAVQEIKDFLKDHMNATDVSIKSDLNEQIWRRGAEKPPSKIRVKAERRDDNVVEASTLE